MGVSIKDKPVDISLEVKKEPKRVPICSDFDEDCDDLDHLHCYLYDPIKGRCPFLSLTI